MPGELRGPFHGRQHAGRETPAEHAPGLGRTPNRRGSLSHYNITRRRSTLRRVHGNHDDEAGSSETHGRHRMLNAGLRVVSKGPGPCIIDDQDKQAQDHASCGRPSVSGSTHLEAHYDGRTWTCQFIQLVYPSEPVDAGGCHDPHPILFIWYPQTLPNQCNSPLPRRHLDKGQLGGSDVEGIDVRGQTGVSLLLAVRTIAAC